jgi:hypothetical protein
MMKLVSSAVSNSVAEEEAFEVEGHKPLVPPGTYKARFIGHATAMMFARAKKVCLEFEICEGPFMGVRLHRYFRAAALLGKTGRKGKFKLRAGGDLYRMMARLQDVRSRPDRISFSFLRSMLLDIKVRTVTHDRNGRELAPGTEYSTIDEIADGS